jgi:hypothetical protein
MIEWLTGLSTLEQILVGMAVIASVLFLIQLIMMLIGGHDTDVDTHVDIDAGGLHADLDMDADAHIDGPGTDVDAVHADADVAFQVVSVQGTIAFFMMLGWVSLAMLKSFGLGAAASIGIGVAAGLAANFVFAKAFQAFKRMQSSGTMDLKNAVGEQGEIYLTIKENEPGKVRVAVQEHLKVFDAVSDEGGEIPTGTRVIVVRVVKGNTMVVKRL